MENQTELIDMSGEVSRGAAEAFLSAVIPTGRTFLF